MDNESKRQGSWFRVSQAVVLRNEKGEVLLLQHRSGKLLFPGGHLRTGETWRDGLWREIKEETGIADAKITGILGG